MIRLQTRRARGFALTEVIISVAILGLMGALVAGTFGRALDAREQAERTTARYHQVRQAMLRMSREIEMAFLSAHRNCSEPRVKTIFKSSSGTAGTRLDFTSFSHYKLRADANESDQNELAYYVGRDPDPEPGKSANALVLLRREAPRIDDDPEEGGIVQVLAEDITSLTFEFYDEKEDRWEDDWNSEGSTFKDRLPMFVTIKLKARGPDGRTEEEFITKTRVFLRRPIYIRGAKCLD